MSNIRKILNESVAGNALETQELVSEILYERAKELVNARFCGEEIFESGDELDLSDLTDEELEELADALDLTDEDLED